MKVKSVILFIVLISGLAAAAYYSYSEKVKGIKTEARILFDSATYFRKKNEIDKGLLYYSKVIASGVDSFRIESLVWSADMKAKQGHNDEASLLYGKAMEYLEITPDPKWSAQIYNSLSWASTQTGNYDSAIFFANKSMLYDSSVTNQCRVKRSLGIIYRRQGNYPKAIEYQLASLKAATEINEREAIALSLNNLGNVYGEIGEDETAILYFDSCIAVANTPELDAPKIAAIANLAMTKVNRKEYDQAEKNLNQMLALANAKGYIQYEPFAYQCFGRMHLFKKEYDKAIIYYTKAKRMYEQMQSPESGAINSQLAQVYTETRDFEKAEREIREFIKLAVSAKNSNKLYLAHGQLFKLDSMRGDFKQAFNHIRHAWELRDSIYGLEKMEMIEEVKQKYAAEQNKKTIALQQAQLEKEKNSKLVIIITSLLGLSVITLLYIFYRQRQKTILSRFQEESKRKRMNAILETQERVQQSIARDLHDGLVQTLGAVKLSLESMLPEINGSMNQRIQHSSVIIDEACREVRTLSHQLLPHSLRKEGLPGALQELAERSLGKAVKEMEFKISGEIEMLNPVVEIHLYRIAQELVNNILRHSRASSVFMYITFLKRSLVLWVEDDGQGFTYNKDSLGVGLLNILARLEMIDGKFNIETSPGRGTSVSISVPLADL